MSFLFSLWWWFDTEKEKAENMDPYYQQSKICKTICHWICKENDDRRIKQIDETYRLRSKRQSQSSTCGYVYVHYKLQFDHDNTTWKMQVQAYSYTLTVCDCQFYMRTTFIPHSTLLVHEPISFSVLLDETKDKLMMQTGVHPTNLMSCEFLLDFLPPFDYFLDPHNGYLTPQDKTSYAHLKMKFEFVMCENCSIDYSLLPPGHYDTCTLK